MSQHWKLLIALVAGACFGLFFHGAPADSWLQSVNNYFLQPVGQIFLRMIFMVVVPLLFSALVLGVVELGQGRGLGKVAGKTLMYTLIISSFAVLIGIGLVNLIKPGMMMSFDVSLLEANASAVKGLQENVQKAKPWTEMIVNLFTKNPVDSAARALDGEIVALMVFAILFGMGLVFSLANPKESVIVKFLEELMQISMKMVEFAMKLAPLAVFALVFNSSFKFGAELFQSLLVYVGVVVLGLLIQQFVVYGFFLKFIGGWNPWDFFKRCREVYLYAFSTASSNATLPKTLDTAENKLGIPPKIARFVLTVGATANQNGTALFEGVTVLFLAQVSGIDLSLSQQVIVVLVSILAGIGTAGVPGGSLPPMMILLSMVGIPPESIGLIIGVDRFLDMCRTTLNVSGDLVIAALVAGPERDLSIESELSKV